MWAVGNFIGDTVHFRTFIGQFLKLLRKTVAKLGTARVGKVMVKTSVIIISSAFSNGDDAEPVGKITCGTPLAVILYWTLSSLLSLIVGRQAGYTTSSILSPMSFLIAPVTAAPTAIR
ncbi:hypothetical protein Tco_0286449 [Tanacetum coccineum]